MGIIVETSEHIEKYPDGERWVIDDHGRLHVTAKGGGNLASFNNNVWLSANIHTGETGE